MLYSKAFIMDDKQYNPAGYNTEAPQKGMAAVDTDNNDERKQADKKQSSLTEKRIEYDERTSGSEESVEKD
jgi:hypothetical protein